MNTFMLLLLELMVYCSTVATIKFFSCMNQFMFLFMSIKGYGKISFVRLFSYMNPFMLLLDSNVVKSFITVITFEVFLLCESFHVASCFQSVRKFYRSNYICKAFLL